ncbi:restless-like transposase [Beauveria bassiana ARSEF 2860]|uniref:Restless-like transposase n=1 Tax=Beauveria bassiana (strain ARSEF 2860) TaxID=655819 RepID=J5J171_BEAB2|nr:restless-like transposase [Beauveria bassiana ARSEF 2860]EJP60698.1 restless-like transposase [Beauveria bassiana ARSEF 2860]
MSQSSDFGATNSVSPSPVTPGPLTPAPSTPGRPHRLRLAPVDETKIGCSETSVAIRGLNEAMIQKSWAWTYGFDIERGSDWRWVCRVCIERNRPKASNVISIGTHNAERHLRDHHKILDNSGKRFAPKTRKKPSTGYQTITNAFNLILIIRLSRMAMDFMTGRR